MKLKDGMWVACVLEDGTKAVGHVNESHGVLYIAHVTERDSVSTVQKGDVQSWCEIIIDWEEE